MEKQQQIDFEIVKEDLTTEKDDKYIIPTKKHPVFTANCDQWGYIERYYKDFIVNNCLGRTFALDYTDAIKGLHEFIQDNEDLIKGGAKINFYIELIDGTTDSYGDAKRKKVYSISGRKAKQLLFN